MTTMDDARKLKIAGQFVSALPFSRALGLELVSLEGNVCEMWMPYREELVGQPDTGVIAGGAVSALMDTCCGTAVLIHPEAVTGTATLDLRIDYMRPATVGKDIIARAECYHVTQSVAFVRATAHDGEGETPVATVAATFTVERRMPR